jgi:hypothetical protein
MMAPSMRVIQEALDSDMFIKKCRGSASLVGNKVLVMWNNGIR